MYEKIAIPNEKVINGQIKELVRDSVEVWSCPVPRSSTWAGCSRRSTRRRVRKLPPRSQSRHHRTARDAVKGNGKKVEEGIEETLTLRISVRALAEDPNQQHAGMSEP